MGESVTQLSEIKSSGHLSKKGAHDPPQKNGHLELGGIRES